MVPAATGRTFSLNAGGLGSVFQPDYAGNLIAQTSPNRLYGVGAYVDAHFSRWLQIEAEGRWLRLQRQLVLRPDSFGEYVYCQNGENTYLIGPRIAPYTFHKFTPYGKVLVGFGSGSFLTGRTFAVAYGGGVDYRLTRRFTLRAFDFEYQQWQRDADALPIRRQRGFELQDFLSSKLAVHGPHFTANCEL